MAYVLRELDAMLEDLEVTLPKLTQQLDADLFMETFLQQANFVEESAGPIDIDHVRSRINVMLSSCATMRGKLSRPVLRQIGHCSLPAEKDVQLH
jgi:hypothetical protein